VKEPVHYYFNIRVHAQGHGINGKNHYKDFKTKVTILGCDNEANTISNPNEVAWKTNVLQETPNRGWMSITIKGFKYSNKNCPLHGYTITGTDAAYVKVSGSNF
jgi:hypothetical protein